MQTLYTGKVHVTGGRDGAARQQGVTQNRVAIDAEIDLNTDGSGYVLAARAP